MHLREGQRYIIHTRSLVLEGEYIYSGPVSKESVHSFRGVRMYAKKHTGSVVNMGVDKRGIFHVPLYAIECVLEGSIPEKTDT